jgi:hypothetical protein
MSTVIEYVAISTDSGKKISTSTEDTDIKALKQELKDLVSVAKDLSKLPDEVTVPNDLKFIELDRVAMRIEEIETLIDNFKAK